MTPTPASPHEQRMASEKISSLLLRYSIPPIIGMLVNALYNVVDRFWVGRIPDIGRDALAGIGLCLPVMNVLLGFCMLLGIGAATVISIRLGQNNRDGAEHVLGNTLSLVGIFGVIIPIIGLIFAEEILTAAGADENMLPYALEYYQITIGGYGVWMLSFSMNHPIRAAGNTKRFASTQLVAGFANIILDPIFIFTFGLGIRGAAMATIAAQLLSASWVFAYYFSSGSTLKIRKKFLKLNKKIVLSVFAIGVSPYLMQIAASVVMIVVNNSLKFYGDIELSDGNIAISAMTLIFSVAMLIIMPLYGINQGAQPVIGYSYGAGNYARVREAYKWSMIYAVIVCSVGFIITQFFAVQLISMFNDDPELVAVGSLGMRVFLSCIILIGMQMPTINFFQAIGRAKAAIFLSLIRQIAFLIPAYLILPIFFGLMGIWLAGPLSDSLAFFVTMYLVAKELKKLREE